MSITVSPKYKEHDRIQKFEAWVKKNYYGKEMYEPPKDINLNEVFFYKMDGLHYGPIPYKKVPKTLEALERRI